MSDCKNRNANLVCTICFWKVCHINQLSQIERSSYIVHNSMRIFPEKMVEKSNFEMNLCWIKLISYDNVHPLQEDGTIYIY